MRDRKLEMLFEPLEMPNLILKNRFFMAPMGTTYPIEAYKDYLVARAKGDVALITTAETSVHPTGRVGMRHELHLEQDDDIKVLSPTVREVKNAGAKIVAQLNHPGRYAFSRLLGQQPVAPSAIASRYTGETPRELSTQEVDDLVVAFAEAALRAKKAGFDGVEFLGSSGYLISQFLSPLTNKRNDKYGGDRLQRAHFLFSILRETRNRVGEGFNICVKYDAEDGMKGGITLEDSLLLAPKIVEAGADRIHVWAGWHEAARPMMPMFVPRAAFSHLAAAVRSMVDVPVSTVGRINDPHVAADILFKGEADLIGLGRTLLCDPDFVKKTRDGRIDEIRRCTACCECFDQIMMAIRGDEKISMRCSINPELGHEGENLVKKAEKEKHVLVIGGGPAGLEIARISALRGHRITLYEEDEKLGGMVNAASVPPYKKELRNIVDYYASQVKRLSIKVHLGKVFTMETLNDLQPDVIVMATGAGEVMPDIPGIKGGDVFTALEILKGNISVGDRAVVIGGGLIGAETAEYLSALGKKVTLIEQLESIANDVGPSTRWGLLKRLHEKVTVLTSTRVTEVKTESIIVLDQDGNRKEIPADTAVVATGLNSRRDLVEPLQKSGIDYYVIGSCRKPGKISDAIAEAFHLGCQL